MLWPMYSFFLCQVFILLVLLRKVFNQHQFWSSDPTITVNHHISHAWSHGTPPKEFCHSQEENPRITEFLPCRLLVFLPTWVFPSHPNEKHTFHFWERNKDELLTWSSCHYAAKQFVNVQGRVLQDIYVCSLIGVIVEPLNPQMNRPFIHQLIRKFDSSCWIINICVISQDSYITI